MRTPSLSAGLRFAMMSITILAKYMFVPIPALAVMRVFFRTCRISSMEKSWAFILCVGR